jgi:hypothetical protein
VAGGNRGVGVKSVVANGGGSAGAGGAGEGRGGGTLFDHGSCVLPLAFNKNVSLPLIE